MYWPNLKCVAFPVPEIIGVPKKLGQSLDTPTLPLLQNFYRAFIRMDTVIVLAKIVALPVPEIIAIGVLGGVRTPNLGKGRP